MGVGLDKPVSCNDTPSALEAEPESFCLIKFALMFVSRDLIFSRTFCSMFLDSY